MIGNFKNVILNDKPVSTPYSLGKLIDWKLTTIHHRGASKGNDISPYSLGKLIDWKLIVSNLIVKNPTSASLLAREIN